MKNKSLDYYYYFLYNCKNYILEQHVQIVQKLFHGWIVFPRIDLLHLIKSRFKLSCLQNLKKRKTPVIKRRLNQTNVSAATD